VTVQDRQGGPDRERVLEDRVRELEEELRRSRGARPRTRRAYRDYEETREEFRGIGERKADEVARFFTGMVRASLEGLRVAAESTGYFVEDALERNIPERDEDPTEVKRRLPRDLTRSATRSFDHALDLPGRAAERFERAYTIEEGGIPRSWRSRGRASGRRGRRRVPAGEDYERWSLDELYDRAAELGVEGFRDMNRDEVIDAIRGQTHYEEWSDAELHLRAADLGIDNRAHMTREELIEETRGRESRAEPARPPVQEETIERESNLERLSKAKLQERASEAGVDNPEGMTREQLVSAIRERESRS
jgi:hypothetical protein